MSGSYNTHSIPTNVFDQLKVLLAQTSYFESTRALQNLFSQSSISQWKNDIPEGISVHSRIESLVYFLYDKVGRNQQNALLLFLITLRENIHGEDALNNDLQRIITLLEPILPPQGAPSSIFSIRQEVEELIDASEKVLTQETEKAERTQRIDYWAKAFIKNRLNIFSEMIANEASGHAILGAKAYSNEMINVLIPLLIDLRWSRGYRIGLNSLFQLPDFQKKLKDFHFDRIGTEQFLPEGILFAEVQSNNDIHISIGDQPIAKLMDVPDTEKESVLNSINSWGRFVNSSSDGIFSPLEDQLGEIPIGEMEAPSNPKNVFFKNREALYPLIARFGFSSNSWILPDAIELHTVEIPEDRSAVFEDAYKDWAAVLNQSEIKEEEFDANRPFKPFSRFFR